MEGIILKGFINMSDFLKSLITKKLKQLTPEEIFYYGRQYGFNVSKQEAKQITNYLKSTSLNPFNEKDRKKAFQTLSQINSTETAHKAEQLLIKLVESHGLDSVFDYSNK